MSNVFLLDSSMSLQIECLTIYFTDFKIDRKQIS